MLNRHGTSHGWTKHTTWDPRLQAPIIDKLWMNKSVIHHVVLALLQ